MARKLWICLSGSVLMILLAITRFPVSATVLVPMQYGDHVGSLLKDECILVARDRFESFNCSYHRSVPCFGWQVWLSQSTLVSDATAKGYYCEITYAPVIPWFTWRITTGNSRMIGLQ